MAKPRVFLSSTFYDLHQSREDIERFIVSLGYDCVRHEVGGIPYAKDVRLETSAYREVELCDIFVTVIGGKFGSESKDAEGYSITQTEITHALEKGIQVYIFVENNTLTEYQVWKINQDNISMKYRFADDPRIYTFVDSLYSLPNNNPIKGFNSVNEITAYLQEQWAGLFHRYLNQQTRLQEVAIVTDMRSVATTLREMVDFLSTSNADKDEALRSILLTHHPIFSRLKKFTQTTYRVFFTDIQEMKAWLSAKGWQPAEVTTYSDKSVDEWFHAKIGWIEFKKQVFNENGSLKNFSASDWNDDWIQLRSLPDSPVVKARIARPRVSPIPDDDIPF
jgi:hypothetical protein